uniref:Pectinesterase 2.2 n=1 Tax=Solanum lycopersicum TaxID=4081 RepID=PME22_SOLLC|nr:RecName: Full=Pectinesterase 2.2; Short=PE 2.2; AltName: Full=Pectin methylesterase 2.2; Flags: Precursor [Solanum lycopersicum]AAB38792.1 pectin methylesterase [Solanum lycopersicum]
MATPQQPLLTKTHKQNSIISFKILTFVVTLFVALFLVVFLVAPYQFEIKHSNLCKTAQDSQLCLSYVSDLMSNEIVTTDSDGLSILMKFLVNYVHQMNNAIPVVSKMKNQINDIRQEGALTDCLELLDQSVDLVSDSIAAIDKRTHSEHANAQSWLSGVLTNHVTCLDELDSFTKAMINGTNLDELISRAKVALAMLASVTTPNDDVLRPGLGKMPSWVSSRDRKLMESSGKDIGANAVVAKDGTGKYRTLAEAVAAAPDKSKTRYVIYVKRGIYKENVEVSSRKMKLMIVGDGMHATIITGNLNVVDGSTTFHSATLAAVGKGFILQDICIQNTAGPAKHQAVALRVGADKSVINRCRIDAYQDTLYAHSQRQFYRDSYVTGTIDFIFGNAAVVFQKCKLVARKPGKYQQNMVTAQGRTDPNQATGTSIQFCNIIASSDLEPVLKEFPTYLGRPWKKYSRTVVMESYLGGLINPAGWAEWDGDFALKTLYYGEFMNNGPGAGTSKRVKWPGYHCITDPAEAMPFTVAKLIQGGSWLRSTGVAYVDGLYD